MTPDQIHPDHTYRLADGRDARIESIRDGYVFHRELAGALAAPSADFASLCVRDITPAPESHQGNKAAQAQSQGGSCMNGMDVLPCPFCGDGGIIAGSIDLYCSTCGASGPSGAGTEAEDIARWNRRTPPATDAVNAELLAACRAVLDARGLIGECKALGMVEAAIARAEANQ